MDNLILSLNETINQLSRKCPKCGTIRQEQPDIENIDEYGECLTCEKQH